MSDREQTTEHAEDCTCASCDPGRLGFKLPRSQSTIEGIIEVAIFRELQRQEADTHRLPNPIYVAIDEPFEISMVVRAVIGSLYDNGYQILHEVAMPDPMGAAMSAHSACRLHRPAWQAKRGVPVPLLADRKVRHRSNCGPAGMVESADAKIP